MADIPPEQISIMGIKLIHFVAGGLGGAVRAITRPDLSWARRISTGLAGALVSGYGTPVLAPFAHIYLDKFGVHVGFDEIAGLVGFVLGMTGLSIAEGIIRWARKWRDNPTLPPLPPGKL